MNVAQFVASVFYPFHCRANSEKVGRVTPPLLHRAGFFFLSPPLSLSHPLLRLLSPPLPGRVLSGHQPASHLRRVCLCRDASGEPRLIRRLAGLRRVILGKSVCRRSSNGERGSEGERTARTTRRREEREEGARLFSGVQLALSDTGCAQQTRVTRDER